MGFQNRRRGVRKHGHRSEQPCCPRHGNNTGPTGAACGRRLGETNPRQGTWGTAPGTPNPGEPGRGCPKDPTSACRSQCVATAYESPDEDAHPGAARTLLYSIRDAAHTLYVPSRSGFGNTGKPIDPTNKVAIIRSRDALLELRTRLVPLRDKGWVALGPQDRATVPARRQAATDLGTCSCLRGDRADGRRPRPVGDHRRALHDGRRDGQAGLEHARFRLLRVPSSDRRQRPDLLRPPNQRHALLLRTCRCGHT